MDPLWSRDRAGVLSVRVQSVRSRTSQSWARMSGWQTSPACSRSEFVRQPLGFVQLTTSLVTVGGKCWCHRRGVAVVEHQARSPHTFGRGVHCPKEQGVTVYNFSPPCRTSAKILGPSQRRSSNWSWMGLARVMRSEGQASGEDVRADCRCENEHITPENVSR